MSITGEFLPWPNEIDCDALYTLAIYVRRPGIGVDRGGASPPESLWIGQLIIRTDPPSASLAAADIAIDSPYDLKRWSFQIKRPSLTFQDAGWLRIGEEALDSHSLKPIDGGMTRTRDEERRELRQALKGSPEWEIELPLRFNSPWRKVAFVGVFLGVLLAAPSLIAILAPSQMNHYQKAAAIAAALLTASGASVLAIFQIKKPT